MNLYDLFLKPYESYTTIQIILEAIAATFGILSVYFSIKKIFGFIQLALSLLHYMFTFFLFSDFWEIV